MQPCAPAPQALPQLPQLFTSKPVLVQEPLQLVRKPAHMVTQLPNWQAWFAPHARPHAPQLFRSVWRRTHWLPHRVKPAAQVQAPPTHWPPPHEFPHDVQLPGSVSGFTHRLPQRMKPVGHEAWHVPFEQMPVAPHDVPHMPQLFGSVEVVVHVPLQSVWPGAQVQVPLTQAPSPHEVPHEPQVGGKTLIPQLAGTLALPFTKWGRNC